VPDTPDPNFRKMGNTPSGPDFLTEVLNAKSSWDKVDVLDLAENLVRNDVKISLRE
jgi:hypothetical protein